MKGLSGGFGTHQYLCFYFQNMIHNSLWHWHLEPIPRPLSLSPFPTRWNSLFSMRTSLFTVWFNAFSDVLESHTRLLFPTLFNQILFTKTNFQHGAVVCFRFRSCFVPQCSSVGDSDTHARARVQRGASGAQAVVRMKGTVSSRSHNRIIVFFFFLTSRFARSLNISRLCVFRPFITFPASVTRNVFSERLHSSNISLWWWLHLEGSLQIFSGWGALLGESCAALSTSHKRASFPDLSPTGYQHLAGHASKGL